MINEEDYIQLEWHVEIVLFLQQVISSWFSAWFGTGSAFLNVLNNWSELTARQYNVTFGNNVDKQFRNNE